MKMGFVGLGHMGGPMSRNVLAAGHDLVVHDLHREAGTALVAAGAAWAASPRETAPGRDVVITMLPAPWQVEEVLLGPAGLLDGLRPGAVWIDMSTSVPAVADRVRAVAAPRGIEVLDAPVRGMASGARAGTLQIFVGGDAGTYQRARPLLEAMGDPERILHVGAHGAGYTVKLMINLLWFAHLTATAEVLTVGTAAGWTWPRCAAACWPAPPPATSSSGTCCRCCTTVTTTSRSRSPWPARISAWPSTWPGIPACRPRSARW
jgi:3-hydroxyisobutyrate dehydrogenase